MIFFAVPRALSRIHHTLKPALAINAPVFLPLQARWYAGVLIQPAVESVMPKIYVHVSLLEATPEQSQKFDEIMSNFHYLKSIKDDDELYRLPPGGYVINSKVDCDHIVSQTFSIAHTAGVYAHIFACVFNEHSSILPVDALADF